MYIGDTVSIKLCDPKMRFNSTETAMNSTMRWINSEKLHCPLYVLTYTTWKVSLILGNSENTSNFIQVSAENITLFIIADDWSQ